MVNTLSGKISWRVESISGYYDDDGVILFQDMENSILSPMQMDEMPIDVELTPEQERIRVIKRAAQNDVVAAAERYMISRDRAELAHIQAVCDALDDAFVMVITQADGIPVCVTFNPGGDIPTLGDDDKASEVLS